MPDVVKFNFVIKIINIRLLVVGNLNPNYQESVISFTPANLPGSLFYFVCLIRRNRSV